MFFLIEWCSFMLPSTLTIIQILLALSTSLDLDPTCFITIIEITPQIIRRI